MQPTTGAADPGALDIYEPLEESAMLALEWSRSSCRDCASYHGAWQVLRALGVLNSMRSDDDFLLSQLDAAIANGAQNILVSGAADYALQARISAVAKKRGADPRITVIDLCDTPLKLNQWYAGKNDVKLRVLRENILDFQRPGYFDLVCTHSFLPFFSPAERTRLLESWWNCLAPGGAVLTAQRVRPDDESEKHGFSEEQAEGFGQRAYDLAAANLTQLAIKPTAARQLAVDYARGRSTYIIRSLASLRTLFEQQGFRLEHFAPPGARQLEGDLPSTPTAAGHQRVRILARKPVT